VTRNRKLLTSFLCIGILIFPRSARSQEIRRFELPANRTPAKSAQLLPKFRDLQPRIGLALSGGGSRGLAHIGVLKVFEENHIPIDYIVGTSMGNVVGGLYASGYSADEIWQMMKSIRWEDIVQDQPPRVSLFLSQKQVRDRQFLQFRLKNFKPVIPSAISPGQQLYNYLSRFVLLAPFHAIRDYDDLKIPFRCIATDLVTGQKNVFNNGELAQVMLASSAIPLLFTPVLVDTSLFVDGGILENIPVTELKAKQLDLIIAVDTTSPLRPKEKIIYPWQLVDQVTTIMQRYQNQVSRDEADILISPLLYNRTNTDFDSLESLFLAGITAAKSQLPDLLAAIAAAAKQLKTADSTRWNIAKVTICEEAPAEALPLIATDQRSWRTGEIDSTLKAVYQTGVVDSVYGRICRAQDSSLILDFYVKPQPYLQEIHFYHNQLLPDSLLLQTIENRGGERFNIRSWQTDRERILRLFREHDYPLAYIRQEELDPATGILKVWINEGKIAGISLSGNEHTHAVVILREYPLKSGDFFRFDLAQKGITNIFSSGLFDRVQPEYRWQNEQIHIIIHVVEKPATQIQFSYNYSRDDRLQAQFCWLDDNLFGLGNRLVITSIVGKRRFENHLRLQSDRIFKTYLSSSVDAQFWQQKHYLFQDGEIIGEYQERRSGLRLSLGQQLSRTGLVSLELRLEQFALRPVLGSGYPTLHTGQTSLRLLSIVDSLDKLPFPNHGRYHYFYYEMSNELLGNKTPFFKLYSSLETYYTYFRRWTFHPKLIWATADLTTPFQEMYQLGGENSFFGFRQDEERGRRLFQSSIEIRYFLPSKLPFETYFSLRYDIGDIWKNSLQEIVWADFVQGYGGTLSFDSILGTFSVSYGENSLGRKNYYFNLGFKF